MPCCDVLSQRDQLCFAVTNDAAHWKDQIFEATKPSCETTAACLTATQRLEEVCSGCHDTSCRCETSHSQLDNKSVTGMPILHAEASFISADEEGTDCVESRTSLKHCIWLQFIVSSQFAFANNSKGPWLSAQCTCSHGAIFLQQTICSCNVEDLSSGVIAIWRLWKCHLKRGNNCLAMRENFIVNVFMCKRQNVWHLASNPHQVGIPFWQPLFQTTICVSQLDIPTARELQLKGAKLDLIDASHCFCISSFSSR